MEDQKSQLIIALINAKRSFNKTGLAGSNAHLKAKYAKLADIYRAVEEALHDNGILIIHLRHIKDGKETLVTQLRHTAGAFIEDCCFLESEKPGNQGKGASLTYMKRYAVLNLCAIATEESDDDGQEEQNYINKNDQRSYYEKPELWVSLDQIREIEDELIGMKEIEQIILKGHKIDTWSQLPKHKFAEVMGTIMKSKTNI